MGSPITRDGMRIRIVRGDMKEWKKPEKGYHDQIHYISGHKKVGSIGTLRQSSTWNMFSIIWDDDPRPDGYRMMAGPLTDQFEEVKS